MYYSYEHYFHIDIDCLSKQKAQKVCTKLIDLGLSFTVTNTYANHGELYLIKIETSSATTLNLVEELMQAVNIEIVI